MSLQIDSVYLQNYTTTEMLEIELPVDSGDGMQLTGTQLIYNSTLKKLCFYNGTEWEQVNSTVIV
jgi:hypothetical protein